MADIRLTCETCSTPFKDVFDPSTGTRDFELIAGDLETEEQCFVRDEIKFVNNGRLIFKPRFDREKERGDYFDEYFVICRKLTVIGGHKPGQIPCEPDSPGSMYNANNVIIWKDRLKDAADGGPPNPPKSADGQSYGGYSDTGIGNDGKKGDDGKPGDPKVANPGVDGMKAPKFTLICTEIEMGLGDHLTIDFNGQNGGEGGRGQKGGNGGKGMNGRGGESDTSWPGKGCDRQPGNGGDGGSGGEGGPGGAGGNGGEAGDITIISTTVNITTGPFGSGSISYINGGGYGGRGGNQGLGGQGGFPGQPGFKTSECSTALAGSPGLPGIPTTLADAMANRGPTGIHGNTGILDIEELTTGECADAIPLDPQIGPLGLQPSSYCRGFSTPATANGSISGQYLNQISSVSVSLAGITAIKKATSTDTQLDLRFDISGSSATGTGHLTLERYFGANATMNNAITVQHFDVTGIAPANGAKNTSVNVTITGQCFDPGALAQHVIVSGLGITVYNVVIIDSTTITCTFDIGGPLAALGARDVTVVVGLSSRTLLNSFTVTA